MKLFINLFIKFLIFSSSLFFCKTYKEKELAEVYFPQGRFRTIGNLEIFVLEKNLENKKLTPLLFIHGFSGNVHTWEEIFNSEEIPNPMVAIDLPGFGLSAKPRIAYSREFYVEFLEEVRHNYAFTGMILAGNSFGGELAIRFTLRYPEHVKKLFLISSTGLLEAPEMPVFVKNLMIFFTDAGSIFFRNRFAVRYFLSQALYDPSLLTERKIDTYYYPLWTEGGYTAHLELFRSGYKPLGEEELKSIKQPVFLLWGEKDNWIPVKYGIMFFKAFPDARLLILPDAGHIPQEQVPGEVIRYLKEFIN